MKNAAEILFTNLKFYVLKKFFMNFYTLRASQYHFNFIIIIKGKI